MPHSRRRPSFRLLRELYRRPASAIGTSLVILFFVLALIGPWITPYGPTQQIASDARQGPSWSHWFGTDMLGRDIFSRIIHGSRSILSLTGVGALIAVFIGTAVGLISGYRGGWLDEIIMRLFDSLLAIPALLLALVLLGAVGQSQSSVLIVIAVVYVPIVARVVRSEVLSIKSLGYIEAARLRGETLPYLLVREILPAVLPALSVEAALRFSYGIFLVASLGYLGVGVQPPTPDWGLMVKEARTTVRLTPWALYFPAGAISLLVIAVNLTADGLKSALRSSNRALSPRARHRIVNERAVRTGTDVERSEEATLAAHRMTASYLVRGQWLDALREITLTIRPGETLGVVGESGSGKSTLALAIVQYLSANGAVRQGALRYRGASLLGRSRRSLRDLRRTEISLIPQNPMASLNPSMRIGKQLAEAVKRSPSAGKETLGSQIEQLLATVRIGDAKRVMRQYPHQLSGGMQQRVVIAMALAADPRFLILDEPTTGLDVTTEAAILDLVSDLLAEESRSALYISHDLGVVSRVSDRLAVLYAGDLLETGPVRDVFSTPQHPYTAGLLNSIPHLSTHRTSELTSMRGSIPSLSQLPSGCVFAPRCPLATDACAERPPLESLGTSRSVRCHHWARVPGMQADAFGARRPRHAVGAPSRDPVLALTELRASFPVRRSLRDFARRVPRKAVHAVRGVDATVMAGRTLGVVGESGSGKTTLARTVLGLTPPSGGHILLRDRPLPAELHRRRQVDLKELQAVSQNPDQALNPHMSIGTALRRQLTRLNRPPRRELQSLLAELLVQVGLSSDYEGRLPSQLSGGEKQRVAIARAMAAHPDVVLCDEATSSLDVSVQARILNLLNRLQTDRQTAYVFITHDLAVVAHLAHEIAVMYLGQLMEVGATSHVLRPPFHPYTEALLSAFPSHDISDRDPIRLSGEIPSPVTPPSGCPFHTRCPRSLGAVCATDAPPWQTNETGHAIYCHIPREELNSVQRPLVSDAQEGRLR